VEAELRATGILVALMAGKPLIDGSCASASAQGADGTIFWTASREIENLGSLA